MKVATAVGAFAVLASALHEEKRQAEDSDMGPLDRILETAMGMPVPTSTQSVNMQSILEVLATGLPQSLLDLALSNAPALSSVVASEFAATQTPDWFGALPGNVQSYLIPPTTSGHVYTSVEPATPISISLSHAHPTSTVHGGSHTGLPSISAAVITNGPSGSRTTTLATSSRPSNATIFSTAALSTGGAVAAALPTGVIGAGFAGVLGVAGLLAL